MGSGLGLGDPEVLMVPDRGASEDDPPPAALWRPAIALGLAVVGFGLAWVALVQIATLDANLGLARVLAGASLLVGLAMLALAHIWGAGLRLGSWALWLGLAAGGLLVWRIVAVADEPWTFLSETRWSYRIFLTYAVFPGAALLAATDAWWRSEHGAPERARRWRGLAVFTLVACFALSSVTALFRLELIGLVGLYGAIAAAVPWLVTLRPDDGEARCWGLSDSLGTVGFGIGIATVLVIMFGPILVERVWHAAFWLVPALLGSALVATKVSRASTEREPIGARARKTLPAAIVALLVLYGIGMAVLAGQADEPKLEFLAYAAIAGLAATLVATRASEQAPLRRALREATAGAGVALVVVAGYLLARARELHETVQEAHEPLFSLPFPALEVLALVLALAYLARGRRGR